MITINADRLQDGLYNVKDGQIFEYKAKGGTVRTYEMGEISQQDFGTLCICAIRYCHGRKTYMPSLVQGIIRGCLKDLSDNDIKKLYDDCRYMNLSDYGDPAIDRPKWMKWESDLRKEIKRREKDYSHHPEPNIYAKSLENYEKEREADK